MYSLPDTHRIRKKTCKQQTDCPASQRFLLDVKWVVVCVVALTKIDKHTCCLDSMKRNDGIQDSVAL